MISFIPFLVLIVLITCCVAVFGNATLDGASQVSLLAASAVSVLIGHFTKRLEWENLEKEITDKIASCTPAIIILLLIGAIGGTWMVSGTPAALVSRRACLCLTIWWQPVVWVVSIVVAALGWKIKRK